MDTSFINEIKNFSDVQSKVDVDDVTVLMAVPTDLLTCKLSALVSRSLPVHQVVIPVCNIGILGVAWGRG